LHTLLDYSLVLVTSLSFSPYSIVVYLTLTKSLTHKFQQTMFFVEKPGLAIG